MSVHGKPMPPPQTILAAIDQAARNAVQQARTDIAPIVARETPRASGRTAAALRPRVTRTATGAALVVAAPRSKAHGGTTVSNVVRWVNRGTGLYRVGPGPKHKIRATNPLRSMTLPGGRRRRSVRGQHPNEFIARIKATATPRVELAFERGAIQAARDAEAVFR